MVKLALSKNILDRADARSPVTTAPQLRATAATMVQAATTEPVTPHDFETEAASVREDRQRARLMRRVRNRPGPTNWLNLKDRLWLTKRRLAGVVSPPLDRAALDSLIDRLAGGLAGAQTPKTHASSRRMRVIRQGLTSALLDAFAAYLDSELRTVTVIYAGWRYTPVELGQVSAAHLKAQLRQHLHRAGVLTVPGPLFAVLHGEFDPTSGCYQLHYHLVTTATKAAALKAGLTAKKIRGYTATPTGAAPVRRSRLGDRTGQLTYLAKAYWPSKPTVWIGGKLKRTRHPQRIPEPYATQVLLWLDRQPFADLVMMQDCWSRRNGGSAAMKRLYLFVTGLR